MTVHLVGAGPGDPGLITVRGAELLARADVVVHDRLSAAELLELAPPSAIVIDVGKRAGESFTQQSINELLIEHGRSGRCVVRLKGGDPFVFARGGEEAAALEAAGVVYEVVPGITSAIAAPTYAGIPVTLRYSSTSFTVVTGHEDPTKEFPSVNWEALAVGGGTLVILMGVAHLPEITRRLVAGGLPGSTPVAAVRWGTRPNQHTVRATLDTVGDHVLAPPSVIVVGEVAREHLGWFEAKPLLGRTIVVTRARQQSGDLARQLRELGAEVIAFPVIDVADPSDGGAALAAAAASIGEYDWVVLTSANGAERLLDAVGDPRRLGGVRLAGVGPMTAAVLGRRHLIADLVPGAAVAESLLAAMPAPPPGGGRVLLARAEVARDVLPEGLATAGWAVDVVDSYRTVTASPDPSLVDAVRGADVVTFTSSSTVERLIEIVGHDGVPPIVASIGPVTTATAVAAGLDVTIDAQVHTVAGLVAALVDWAST